MIKRSETAAGSAHRACAATSALAAAPCTCSLMRCRGGAESGLRGRVGRGRGWRWRVRGLGRVGQGIHSGRSAPNKFVKYVVRRVQKCVVLKVGAIPVPALQVVDPIESLTREVFLERVTTALRRRRGNHNGQRDGIEGSM